ncbi:MAG TPA: DUF2924 domain-containing protein [Polyangia bacterium]|nr:DUF2924 domain-containing protein [Polyangia bacterium]
MALKNWQMNKKNNAPQKKGQGKEKPAAKTSTNERQAQRTAQDAEPRPEAVTSPEAVTEHAEPHTSEVPVGEIHEQTNTDVTAASPPDLPAEGLEVDLVAPEASETAPASEPAVEATPAEPTTTARIELPESTPAQPEPAVAESGAEAQVMTVAPEETQAAEETHAAEPAPAEPAPAEPAPVEPGPAEHALIEEATVATEQPAAATEPTSSTNAAAENEPTPSSKEAQPRERDPRLPPPGTVLQRRDRHGNVRCECTVEQDGIRYAGKLYKSLSAAAIAATKDMGLKSKTQNGHTFWGVAKPARPAKSLLEVLERVWERYREHAEIIAAQSGADDGQRARVRQAIEKHVEILAGLRARVA